MAPPELRLGLIGCGTVGSAFATSLAERREWIERHLGVRLRVTGIAVAHPDRPRPNPLGVPIHGDAAAIAADPSVDVVIEASGAPPAGDWLHTALRRGAAVVTANKQALARDPVLLDALATRNQLLFCEGAVAAAVPIVRALRDSLAGEDVLSLRGVLNGTTTYILSRLERHDSFAHALAIARAEGYAEQDPTADLCGADAAAKLAILCSIAWHQPVTAEQVRTSGIDDGIAALVEDAAKHGARVRLVATADRDALGNPNARVEPRIVDDADPLATATGVLNVIQVKTALAGTLTWFGPGAGGRSTASALLGDTIAAARTIARGTGDRVAATLVPSRVAAGAAA
jgi:homoserine dehydrogenase